MKSTQQWPLVIDPHKQALHWIRQMEGPQLQEISAEDSGYLQMLKTAMQVGACVLLQVFWMTAPDSFFLFFLLQPLLCARNIKGEALSVQDLCQTSVCIIIFTCVYYICAHVHIA